MTSVTFPPRLGGTGITISDDADPRTGLLNGGHERLFVPGLQGVVDMANYVYQYAGKIDKAASDAARAEDARGYVEGYAAALRSNLVEDFAAMAAADINGVTAEYRRSGFTTKRSDDIKQLFEFSRTSPRWVIGATGKLMEVPSGVPARRFRSRSGENLGLALVSGKTNMIPYSGSFTGTGWYRQQVTVSPDYAQSPLPDNWSRLTVAQGAGGYIEYRSIPGAPGRWGALFFVRSLTGPTLWKFGAIHVGESEGSSSYVDIDLHSGEIGDYSDPANRIDDVYVEPLKEGGYIVALSFTTTELCTEIRSRILATASDESKREILLCGMQVQTGYPSDYIPTDGGTVTTAADQIVIKDYPVDGRRGTIFIDYAMDQMEGGNSLINIYGGELRVSFSSGNSLIASGAFVGATIYNGGLRERKRIVVTIDNGVYQIFNAGRLIAKGDAEFSHDAIRLPGINTLIRRFIFSPEVIQDVIAKELSA